MGGGMGGAMNNDTEYDVVKQSAPRHRARSGKKAKLPEQKDENQNGEITTDAKSSPKNPVQTVGDKTFYWKNNRWRDSDVTPEGEKHPIRIKAFSSQYFALAGKSDGQFAKYLSLEGPILITLEGKTYLIEPSKDKDKDE